MARGIEHRSIESVLDAYDLMKKPNWGLFAGRDIVVSYNEGNIDAGANLLDKYLQMLQANGSNAVFTLKLYPDSVTTITDKTPFEASTTVMLGAAPVKTENGMVVIDRGSQSQQYMANNPVMQSLQQRLDSMEKMNRDLQQKFFDAQLQMMKKDYEHKIAGTAAEEKSWVDKLMDHVAQNPEAIGNTLKSILEPLANIFSKGNKNHIINTAEPGHVAGTAHKTEETMKDQHTKAAEDLHDEDLDQEDLDQEEEEEGGEGLTEAEELLLDEQDQLMTEMEENGSNIEQMTIMIRNLHSLSTRIGTAKLCELITQVSALNDKDLNKLLNHMD